MATIFLQKDAQELLKNKYIVVMGGSIQRSIYKDLIRLIQGNAFLTDNLLRMKGEDSCLKDQLLDGGMRGKDKKGIGYREVRQYQTDFYFLQYVFMTRSYNSYVESVINKLAGAEQKPDAIIINSCLWDITRYGKKPDISEYKLNLQRLFKKLKEVLPNCLVIWNTNPAISHNPKGGVFIPGLDYLKDSMELHVLESNYYASKVAIENGHDVVDLHYFLRHQIHRRAEDGIHWDMTGHRRISNLLLTHIAQTWGVKLPKHIKINGLTDSNQSEQKQKRKSKSPAAKMFQSESKLIEVKEEKSEQNNQENIKHSDIVVVEVPKDKPEAVRNNNVQNQDNPNRKKNKKKRNKGNKWKNERQLFEYNHQPPGVEYDQQSAVEYGPQSTVQFDQQSAVQFPEQNPLAHAHAMQQRVHHFQQNYMRQASFQRENMVENRFHRPAPINNPFHRQDFSNDNFQMLNFDNGQWQPYQEEDLSHGRRFQHPEPPRYNPYNRGHGGAGYY